MQDDSFSRDIPIIAQLKTNDADELSEFLHGWNQDYIQLRKGNFGMEVTTIEIGSFQFIDQFSSVSILYRGSSPSATFALGIPAFNLGEILYGGNIVSENSCITGNFDGYLDVRASSQVRFFVVVAPIQQILAIAVQMQRPLRREQLLSPGIILPNTKAMKQLSDYVAELMLLAKKYPERLMYDSQGNSMAHIILEDFLPLLVDVLTADPNFIPEKKSRRRKLVKRAEIIMRDRINIPITLTDLCQELETSKRSLYYAFEESFGLPPMQYLKILRLHGVRRALKSADPRTSKVTKIAGLYGFWHMGQFSTDYKIMFGESPSTTLKK